MGCFEFCRDISANPAAKLLTGLAAMLLEPDTTGRPYLKLLHSKFGPASSEWPIDVITCLHISAIMAFCRGWRLLFHFFRLYPWPLAQCFDPLLSAEARRAHMEKFLSIAKGSKLLDAGCSRKLRELVDSVDDLLEPRLFSFMQTLFSRVVMTSTFVERLFKDLSVWTNRPHTLAPTAGAKHVITQFQRMVARWREAASEDAVSCKLSGKAAHICIIIIYIYVNISNTLHMHIVLYV